MSTSTKVYGALGLAMLIWGASFVWTKMVLAHYPPITTILLRLLFSVPLLFLISWLLGKLQRVRGRDVLRLGQVALFEPFLYFLGENYGLSLVSSTVGAVVIATIPLITPIAGYYFFRERLSWANLAGVAVCVPGVLLVVTNEHSELDASLAGIGFLLLAVVSTIGYAVQVIRLTDRYNVFTLVTWQNLIGIPYFLPLFWLLDWEQVSLAGWRWEAFVPLLLLALLASSVAFLLFTYAIRVVGMGKASTFTNTIPVFTAFFAVVLLGDRLTGLNLLGIALVVGGLLVSQIRPRQAAVAAAPREPLA